MRAVGLAALVAVGVAVGGFGLQWLGLPRAGTGDVVAARASTWLDRYRESSSEMAFGTRLTDGTCVHGWIDGPDGRDRRGTLLTLAGVGSIRDFPPHTLIVRGRWPRRPVALLQAAGCTSPLASRLAELAQFDGGVRAAPVYIAGESAFAVHFPALTLYVNRRTGLPIGVTNSWIRGRFRLVPVVPGPESS